MRVFYTLTRREVEDHALLFSLVFILGCIYAGMAYVQYPAEATDPYRVSGNIIGLSLLLFASAAAAAPNLP